MEDVNWFVSGFNTFHNIVSASISLGLLVDLLVIIAHLSRP